MAHKKNLLISIILVAFISNHFWIPRTNASQLSAVPRQQNSPIFAFLRASVWLIEPDQGETAAVTLDVGISQAPEPGEEAKVTYVTANGNAIGGVDYVATNGELTYPVGTTARQSFDVTIIGNNTRQQDRVFIVFLTNPINAVVGFPAYIQVTIIDNDEEASSFLPVVRGYIPGPTVTPIPPTETPTPCIGYC